MQTGYIMELYGCKVIQVITGCIQFFLVPILISVERQPMPTWSVQRWADNQCCRCIPPCPDYKTPISGDCFDHTIQDVVICGLKCCTYCCLVLFTWQYTRPGNMTISLFFGALKLFFGFSVFLIKINRL